MLFIFFTQHAWCIPFPQHIIRVNFNIFFGNASKHIGQTSSSSSSECVVVLECLRSEMVILAEFEASKATSAHQVAEYASQIAESMHTREQMLETMYQRLGTLSSFLGPEDVVLVGMGDPPESLVQDVLQSSHYGGKVRYFKGSLMSQKDLHSMELRKASAIFQSCISF